MKIFRAHHVRGFTLIEMMVVIGIIGLLTSVVLFGVSEARQNARDKTRLADIEQLHLQLVLYKQSTGSYPSNPSYDGGEPIGDGTGLEADTVFQALQPNLVKDPKHGSDYYYQYDTDANCTAAGQTVLFVNELEGSGKSNYSDVCTCTSGCDFDGAGPNSGNGGYIILLNN